MSSRYNLYDAIYNNLKIAEKKFLGRVMPGFELTNRRGSFMFRLIGGRVRVKFKPLCKQRMKRRRPGERIRPKRMTLIVGKVIIPGWTALSKRASSLRDVENHITRYNKKLKKTNRK